MKFKLSTLLVGSAALAMTMISAPVSAVAGAEFPPRQMEIIVPHGVGSSQDRITRALGKEWEEIIKTSFKYNNKKGGSTRIGFDYFLQRSQKQLLSTNPAVAVLMYLQQKPDWKWNEEVVPVGMIALDPGAIYVRAESPLKSMEDVLAEARKRTLTVAITHWTSPENLVLHQIMDYTGVKFEVIPYGESKVAVTQVLGGHVDFGLDKMVAINSAGPGVMRYLAITMDENTVPEITNDAPPLSEVLGQETVQAAAYRTVYAHKSILDTNPEGYKKLVESMREAKKTQAFLEEVKKFQLDPKLVVDWKPKKIQSINDAYEKAFAKYGSVLTESK